MRRYIFICILIVLSMILCPVAAIGNGSLQPVIAEEQVIEVIAVSDEGEYITVMSSSSGEASKIEMREYLIGCVAAEMPANYHPEALKAQAAASYTYAKYTMQTGSGEVDITDDTGKHQGYINKEQRKSLWGSVFDENESKISAAVDAVYGNVIVFNGETALTVYHSVSAGATQSAEELWGSEISYLQCVASPGDKLSPDYVQSVSFTESEIADLLEIDSDENGVGETEYTEGGYVSSIEICGQELSGMQVRDKLSLRSNCFDVEYKDGEYIFEVRGHGHGVGMSQYGADYMARQGSTWQEIIGHYYPGTVISETA